MTEAPRTLACDPEGIVHMVSYDAGADDLRTICGMTFAWDDRVVEFRRDAKFVPRHLLARATDKRCSCLTCIAWEDSE